MRKYSQTPVHFDLSTTLNFLALNPTLRSPRMLRSVESNNLINLTDRFQSYERILQRLERSLQPTEWKTVRKLLGWMVCAKRPLKWREIQAAVSMDVQNQMIDFEGMSLRGSVEGYCGSLIQVLSGDRVELVHTTAKM
jgi:GPI inositol-deacylase, winged helix domain